MRESTRGDSTLDIVLNTEPLTIADIDVAEPFGSSDHCQITFTLVVNSASSTTHSAYNGSESMGYLWHKADYEAISRYMESVDWYGMLSVGLTPDMLWSQFASVVNEARDLFVPIIPASSVKSQIRKVSYPARLRRALARKRCIWRQFKKDKTNVALHERYKTAALHISTELCSAIMKSSVNVQLLKVTT